VLGAAVLLDGTHRWIQRANGLAAQHMQDQGLRHRMGLGIVDALVRWERWTTQRPRLADLGHRGVSGTAGAALAVGAGKLSEPPGYGKIAVPDVRPITQYLEDELPADPSGPACLHGRLPSRQCHVRARQRPRRCDLDWELCTVGDPRLDFGRRI